MAPLDDGPVRIWPVRVVRLNGVIALLLSLVVAGALAVMATPLAAAVVAPVVGLVVFGISIRRYVRRARAAREPFPPAWRTVLERRVPFYRWLDADGRDRFENDVRIFLSEQRIFAERGAKLDDDTRVLIAASAAMLGFGIPDWEWVNLRDSVVYPGAFDEDYQQTEQAFIAGMVQHQGPILFSQRDLRLGFSKLDGHNVGLHELAHVMDFADGRADGVPGDVDWVATAPWIELVSNRLAKLKKRKGYDALRRYASENEAELFAVAVEAFFEQPKRLHEKDPELYELLRDYFGQDPAAAH